MTATIAIARTGPPRLGSLLWFPSLRRSSLRYGRYVRPSGYYYRSWRYGDHLPRSYYGRRYIVNDYYAYRLRPPPRGYHWVRVDNDVVLAAIASGMVVHGGLRDLPLMRDQRRACPAGSADGSYCWRLRSALHRALAPLRTFGATMQRRPHAPRPQPARQHVRNRSRGAIDDAQIAASVRGARRRGAA